MASSNHLAHTRYLQGEWFGVVRSGTVVLLGPDTPHALIDTIWELLATAPEAHEVLHEVTDAFGVSLSRIPPFGIIDSKEALHVFLRGDLELAVQLASGEEHLTGRDVTTWTERRLTDAASYSVRIGGNSLPPSSSQLNGSLLNSLPLTEGVVLLASLDVAARDSVHAGPLHVDVVPVVHPAAIPAMEPAPAPGDNRAPERASDETMIGYAEADLGLTIAPGSPGIAPGNGDIAPGNGGVEHEVPAPTGTPDPIVPSLENTTNYDHLWDKTVMRNIEDAAVRVDDESDDHDAPAAKTPDAQPHTVPEAATPAPAVPQVPSVAQVPAVQGLIDSVPWLRSSPDTPEASGPQTAAPARPVADPAPQVPAGWPATPSQDLPADDDSDHDGQTIMKSNLPTDDDAGAKPAPGAAETPAVKGPSVLARVCSQGHANPPTYPQCSVCGVAVTGDSVHVPRPRLGRMRLSTGELIDLDQSLIVGRQPSVSRVQGGIMPRLVQVESPGGDISRSHVEVRLEGWHVMLCDLKATNGTVLIREGQAPRRLAQNEMAILLDGDIAELGDDISLRFEEIL